MFSTAALKAFLAPSGGLLAKGIAPTLSRCASYCADPTIGLNEEQLEIQRMAKQFAKAELFPEADKWDAACALPMEALKKAGEVGFGAIYCREEYGGAGLTRLDASLIFEQLGGGDCSTAAYMAVHNMVPWMLDAYGSEDLRRQYIPGLASFQTLGSYCLTEPDSGSDSSALRTTAVKDGDHYIVNGSKAFISGSGDSKVYLVMLRHKGQDGPKGIFTLLLTPDMPGFHLGKNERKLGWCSQPTRVITFEDVRVPVSNQVGHDNQGFHIAMHGLNSGRVNIASCSLGAAHASLDLAIDYTKQRKAFGKTVSDFQWTQFKLAEMATKLVTARLMTREAARLLDQGSAHSTSMSAMAKFYATDAAFEVVNTALQMYGGYGVLKDYPIQQYLRDCRVHQIIEGTNEVMRLMIGKDLIKNDTHMNS